MGDKLESKRLATKSGVNGIPGYDGVIDDADHCITLANEIGYPVMIKASAGGGGKGMRIAWNDKEAKEAYKLCKEEGANFFGDDRLLVEKFVDSPRHVEIQILGDKHGNAIHLNERECSIQRRNQKVIEEAPSPFLDPVTREAMGAQAIALAQAIGYDSAGTVEFLMDSKKNFYFLEMNTRLQVEHPITECITGVDLVQQMIRVAYGHPLKIKQEDIGINGWAFESRVYAEDPFKNFGMPSIGRLYKYEEPQGIEGVRCDSGIKEGSEISMYYDPMICKLTTYADTRDEAIKTSIKALDQYVIRGVTHNIPLLRDIYTEDKFNSGTFTTSYLTETYPDGFKGIQLNDNDRYQLATIASIMHIKVKLRLRQVLNVKKSSLVKNLSQESWNLYVKLSDDSVVPIQLTKKGDEYISESIDDNGSVVKSQVLKDNFKLTDSFVKAQFEDETQVVQLINKSANGDLRIRFKGTAMNVSVLPEIAHKLSKYMLEKPKIDTSKVILCPMPGVVKDIAVKVGDLVGEGQECCIVEAMKMQNSLKAGITGKVKSVSVNVGDTVEEEQVLVEIE